MAVVAVEEEEPLEDEGRGLEGSGVGVVSRMGQCWAVQ